MKKFVALLVLAVLGYLGYYYYRTQQLKVAPTPGPETEMGRTPAPSQPDKTATKPKTSSVPATGWLLVPAEEDGLFVNGKPFAEGEAKFSAGRQIVTGYKPGSFVHEIVELKGGERKSLQPQWRAAKPSSDWQTFQGSNLRQGFVDAQDRSNLALSWRADLGEKVASSPVVRDGVAYFSSGDHLINAINLSDGSVLWQTGTIGSDVSPILTDQFVFIGDDTGKFKGFRLKDGKTKGETGLGSYNTSVTLVSDEAFIVATGSNDVVNVRTKKNLFGNLPLKQNWEVSLPELQGSKAVPAISGNRMLLQAAGGGLTCLDVETGKVLWNQNKAGSSGQEPVDGQASFSFVGSEPVQVTPVIDGDVVFGFQDQKLQALDINTGKVRWSRDVTFKPTSALTFAYGLLFVGSEEGKVHILSTHQGEDVAKLDLGAAAVASAPIVFKNKLLVASGEGVVFLFSCFDWKLLDSSDVLKGAPIVATPAMAPEGVFVVNRKGQMACFH